MLPPPAYLPCFFSFFCFLFLFLFFFYVLSLLYPISQSESPLYYLFFFFFFSFVSLLLACCYFPLVATNIYNSYRYLIPLSSSCFIVIALYFIHLYTAKTSLYHRFHNPHFDYFVFLLPLLLSFSNTIFCNYCHFVISFMLYINYYICYLLLAE